MSGENRYRARTLLVSAVVLGSGIIGACTKPGPHGEDPGVCWHLDGSRWVCPDSQAAGIFRSGREIASASLVVTTTSGKKVTLPIPTGTDAIFLAPDGLEILEQHYRLTDVAKADAVARYVALMRARP